MRKELILSVVAFLLIFYGCDEKNLPPINVESNIIGLASGVQLNPDKTLIPLSDFFLETDKIEKQTAEDNRPGGDEELFVGQGRKTPHKLDDNRGQLVVRIGDILDKGRKSGKERPGDDPGENQHSIDFRFNPRNYIRIHPVSDDYGLFSAAAQFFESMTHHQGIWFAHEVCL